MSSFLMLANCSSYINVYQINLIVPPSSVGFQLPGGRCLLFTFSAHLLLPTQIDPGMFKRQNDSSTTTNLLYEAFLHLFNTLSKQYGGGGGVVFDDEGGIPGGMFLNSSLAHVINTRASTCSKHTC